MRPDRIYQIRRAVLSAFKAWGGVQAVVKFDDLIAHQDFVFLKPTREELLEAWNDLLGEGYLEYLKDSGREYAKASPSGMCQINREGDLAPFVWGKHALR